MIVYLVELDIDGHLIPCSVFLGRPAAERCFRKHSGILTEMETGKDYTETIPRHWHFDGKSLEAQECPCQEHGSDECPS